MSQLPTTKDQQTVNSDGSKVARLIDGVIRRSSVTHVDERGYVCEIYNPAWGVHPGAMVYSYLFSLRPGKIKGWAAHYRRDDRVFIVQGTVKCVLYDARPESPTYQMVNELYETDYDRGITVIPRGVFHAHQNVGLNDAVFVSLPSEPYDHDDPDVHRLPYDTDLIPYTFETRLGW